MLDSQAATPEQALATSKSYANYTPMLRFAQPEEFAALFLASDERSFMTGSDTWSRRS
jgi:NAD(P)-dependent dehydrogenase (short-subunit alcohol dehydrogenase family)